MLTGIEILVLIIGIILIVIGICLRISTSREPKEYDYYILKMWNLIEPILSGPFELHECLDKLEAYREDPEQSQNSFTEIRVSKGAEIDA